MVNDALYGILYRDINIVRGLIDQRVSRMINGYFGVVINTGEDNYLRTADAIEAAPSVTASQFINHQLARDSGVPDAQIALGDAFEIDVPGHQRSAATSGRRRSSRASCSPTAPSSTCRRPGTWTATCSARTPPTRCSTSSRSPPARASRRSACPPRASSRRTSTTACSGLQNVDYVFNAARDLGEEIEFKRGGHHPDARAGGARRRARAARADRADGLFKAIEDATFGDVSRSVDEGRGIDGIVATEARLLQPAWSS